MLNHCHLQIGHEASARVRAICMHQLSQITTMYYREMDHIHATMRCSSTWLNVRHLIMWPRKIGVGVGGPFVRVTGWKVRLLMIVVVMVVTDVVLTLCAVLRMHEYDRELHGVAQTLQAAKYKLSQTLMLSDFELLQAPIPEPVRGCAVGQGGCCPCLCACLGRAWVLVCVLDRAEPLLCCRARWNSRRLASRRLPCPRCPTWMRRSRGWRVTWRAMPRRRCTRSRCTWYAATVSAVCFFTNQKRGREK